MTTPQLIFGKSPPEDGIYVICPRYGSREGSHPLVYWLAMYDSASSSWGWGKGETDDLNHAVSEEHVSNYKHKLYSSSSGRRGTEIAWCRIPEPTPDLFDIGT